MKYFCIKKVYYLILINKRILLLLFYIFLQYKLIILIFNIFYNYELTNLLIILLFVILNVALT